MIKFVLMVNKQGQTRLAKYTNNKMTVDERRILEGEIVRKCLIRVDKQCNFIEHRGLKVVYRRYASLFFLVGVDDEENELSVLDFIHCLVETLDKWFGNVCELDIMFNLETVSSQSLSSDPPPNVSFFPCLGVVVLGLQTDFSPQMLTNLFGYLSPSGSFHSRRDVEQRLHCGDEQNKYFGTVASFRESKPSCRRLMMLFPRL